MQGNNRGSQKLNEGWNLLTQAEQCLNVGVIKLASVETSMKFSFISCDASFLKLTLESGSRAAGACHRRSIVIIQD